MDPAGKVVPTSPRPRAPASAFFITTAIDYTNAPPHIGHAYEKVLADVLARYQRLRGRDVFLLTGVDQHGQKVQQSADKLGVPPTEFVAGITAQFRALWAKLGIAYDGWAATTDHLHKTAVRTILDRLNTEGHIYKAKRAGYYSVRQEQFLTDKERGPDGAFGPEWGEVVFLEEENYFFRLARHREWLLDLIDRRSSAGRPIVVPDFRVAELRNAVDRLSGDLCISRPKSRLSWGIELPFDPDYVTYVWFDALVNYISFAPGYDPSARGAGARDSTFAAWWPALHVIGKDILVPAHGVYWPIMLKAIGFADDEIPALLVHGWWNVAGAKMSKSTGNVVDPNALADQYSPAALRYYLMRDMVIGRDADFIEDRLISRYNVDLANGLGNLLNRTLNMIHRYRDGHVAAPDALPDALGTFRSGIASADAAYCGAMEAFRTHDALERFARVVTDANALIDAEAPWKLAKDAGQSGRLDAVLAVLVEVIWLAATMLLPFTPNEALAALRQLGLEARPLDGAAKAAGGPPAVPRDHRVGKPVPLFPRIEAPAPQ